MSVLAKSINLVLVHSQVRHSSSIWRPYLIKDISRLEMIHRRATKLNGFSSTFHRYGWKTRWRFHSVDPTSMQVSTLGHGIIHLLVASVVCGR